MTPWSGCEFFIKLCLYENLDKDIQMARFFLARLEEKLIIHMNSFTETSSQELQKKKSCFIFPVLIIVSYLEMYYASFDFVT